ncbi:phosphodiesterase [Janibacter sp. YIM B02568]|uniref:DUF5998 family protein n=1 Tax=Janibacter endophyticus TaxID=2806261 RepID=UPI0019523858|nr:DUF5998 family protein [Janibacter endophyticus]MBM6546232.1 phosphodiesterase [Janibacter endophyticus]
MSQVPTGLTQIPLPQPLVDAVARAGYYPELVADIIRAAVGVEEIVSHLVHQETTFDQEAVRRHITVLVTTPTRLVIAHADDFPDHSDRQDVATATTECIPLRSVRGVMLTHVVPDPSSYVPGSLGRELTLTVGWGTVSRVDLLPAVCADPTCDADHGYEGTVTADDISLRISAEAEGSGALEAATAFARDLSARVGG